MTPFQTAAEWQLAHHPDWPLAWLVEAHAQVGHVHITPELFILARIVGRTWEDDRLCDPWDADPAGDTWHVWLCAGSLAAIPRIVPFPLPWVSMHHRGRLRRLPFASLLRQ